MYHHANGGPLIVRLSTRIYLGLGGFVMQENSKYPLPGLALTFVVLITGIGAFLSVGVNYRPPISSWAEAGIPTSPAACLQDDLGEAAPESCTIITASMGDTVLFGNNEDAVSPETYYWVIPGTETRYGAIVFGLEGMYPEGGVNEMGLAYDKPLHI
jgi:hypothetical protein